MLIQPRLRPTSPLHLHKFKPFKSPISKNLTQLNNNLNLQSTICNVAQQSPILKQEDNNTKNQIQNEEINDVFNWQKQWYPIGAVLHLDGSRPTSAKLLGKDLVLWRDGEGIWRCFEDKCPHRLVPLSEGRIETDGTLQCSYHGWRFNGKGECTKIPQAEQEMSEKLCGNERACANVFPTQEKFGLLWVWGESGENAALECLLKSPNVPPHFKNLEALDVRSWRCQDLPYGYSTLMENILDPSHVPVSHHNLQGNRDNAMPLYLKLKNFSIDEFTINNFQNSEQYEQSSQTSGTGENFSSESLEQQESLNLKGKKDEKVGNQNVKNEENVPYFKFMAPSVVHYHLATPKFILEFTLLGVPTAPGRARLFSNSSAFDFSGKQIPFIGDKIPKWYYHTRQNIILAQDTNFLVKQQQVLQQKQQFSQKGKENIMKLFYVPTLADQGIFYFYEWFYSYGQGGVEYSPDSVYVPPTEQEIYDTYNNHTKICPICSTALKNFKIALFLMWTSSVVLGILAICSIFIQPIQSVQLFSSNFQVFPLQSFLCSVFSVLFAVGGLKLKKFMQRYYFVKFSHADT